MSLEVRRTRSGRLVSFSIRPRPAVWKKNKCGCHIRPWWQRDSLWLRAGDVKERLPPLCHKNQHPAHCVCATQPLSHRLRSDSVTWVRNRQVWGRNKRLDRAVELCCGRVRVCGWDAVCLAQRKWQLLSIAGKSSSHSKPAGEKQPNTVSDKVSIAHSIWI